MTYDTDKLEPGRERIDILQLDVGRCVNTYGVAPCTASLPVGSECINCWESCQDPPNYNETDSVLTLSFCTPVSALSMGLNLIPLLESVTFDPGDVTPDDGIGKVGSLIARIKDAPHDDVGIDPYVSTRPVSALKRGTFWPRQRARWPHYQGRAVRWYTGYVHHPFDLSNLRCRHYVAENLSGFGGVVSLKAKDPLKLADDKRSQFPRKSTGLLAETMTDVSSHSTLDISTSNPTEYDLYPFETVSAVRLKSETVQYNAVSIVTGGVRLMGVSRSAPAPYQTVAEAHEIGDEVQKCAYWHDMLPPTIIGYLLTLGAEAESSWVPVSGWETLYNFWLGSQTMRRLVTEPEGVMSQISAVLLQSNSWGLWWDDVAQEFGYEVFRPAAIGESVPFVTDDSNIVATTPKVVDDTDNLVNDCVFYYRQIDPTKAADDKNNYADGVNYIDGDSAGPKELGSLRTKFIFGTWHANSSRARIRRISERLVVARSSLPFVVTLEMDRKDDDTSTSDFIDLKTHGLGDLHGNQKTTRMRVVKADYSGNNVKYTCRQDFISDRYGLIAPNELRGLTWATATEDQRMTYVFIANNDGFLSDGTPGKRIF